MKLPENLFSRTLLAALPFMISPFDWIRTGVAAVWVVLFFWGTVFFFWFARRFFPERFLKQVFFFWLLIGAQGAWTMAGLQPFWILSVFLLMPVSFLEEKSKAGRIKVFSEVVPQYFWQRFLSGAGFLGFVLLLGFAQDFLSRVLEMRLFQQPAGVFLLLAMASFLWKKQSWERS